MAHRVDRCPDCGGKLQRCEETRVRYTEDIPEVQPEVTEHRIHRDWCPRCKKRVEPAIPDALPGSSLGNHVLVLSAWLHYGLGNALSQIVEVFNFHLQMKISAGGLVQMWSRALRFVVDPTQLFAAQEFIPKPDAHLSPPAP